MINSAVVKSEGRNGKAKSIVSSHGNLTADEKRSKRRT